MLPADFKLKFGANPLLTRIWVQQKLPRWFSQCKTANLTDTENSYFKINIARSHFRVHPCLLLWEWPMHKYCKRLPWIAVAAQLRAEVASASDSFCKVMSVFSSQPGEPNQTRVWWTFRTNWAEEDAPTWNGVLIFGSNFIISLPCAWNLTKSEELKCSLLHCFQQAVISNSIKRTWKIWTIAIFFLLH